MLESGLLIPIIFFVVGVGVVAQAVNPMSAKMNRNAIIGARLRMFGCSSE